MLGYVYWPSEEVHSVPAISSSVKTAMMCSTLAGTMVGQIGFGFAADVLGRRKMYGLELVIIIIGTMLLLMSSGGVRNSMDVAGWLITWRAVMGTSDPKRHMYRFNKELTLLQRRGHRRGLSSECSG